VSDEPDHGLPRPDEDLDEDLDEQVRIAERPHAGPADDAARIEDDTVAADAGDDSASGEPG
jgi:hypothetical protein